MFGIVNTAKVEDDLLCTLPEIIEKRRDQFVFRIAMMLVMVIFFSRYGTLAQMATWGGAYMALQLAEHFATPFLGSRGDGRPGVTLPLLSLNSLVFGYPAVLWGVQGGPVGLVNSTYLLAGAVLNTVLTTRNCAPAFAASLWPLLAYSAATAVVAGGRPFDLPVIGTVATGGAMLGFSAVMLWREASATRRSELMAQRAILKGEIELKAAAEAAEAASRAKSDFLANMSHEIRTPLNGVVAMADILARSPLPPQQLEMAQIIQSSGATLQRLLSDILDVARIEAGKLEVEIAPFHLGEAVRDVVALSRLKCDEKGLALDLKLPPELDRFVAGDVTRVRQVLTNLLSNAAKFTDGGKIEVVVEARKPHGVRLSVSDTGIGFPLRDKARVLGRFEQADSSITRRFGGSGLGLSICSDLARLMDGVLDCTSKPGGGSRFWLEVPLPFVAAPALAASASAPSPDSEAHLKILVADDHPTNRKVIELMLGGSAVELTFVENGEEAVREASGDRFDLILMDMQMPVMDGITALKTIRRMEADGRDRRTPVIMLTANALPEHVAAADVAGADRHLAKPFTAEQLFSAISDALACVGVEDETSLGAVRIRA